MNIKKSGSKKVIFFLILLFLFVCFTVESPIGTTQAAIKKQVVAIDAGHQQKGDTTLEPIGPGAKQKKAKVASGTTGRYSKIPEYKVTLQVAQKLKKELENRGYQVVMIRDKNNVNLSNAKRAEIANNSKADVFLRLHCNGSDNSSVHGALTMCQTNKNPYNAKLYSQSYHLSKKVLEGLCDKTGAKKRSIIKTDSMSGINWAKIPVTIVEMGFMTNKKEDLNLIDAKYQKKIAAGIADGVDAYFLRE